MSKQGDLPGESSDHEMEVARQLVMQRWLREEMGGLVPEQPDLSGIERVLDVACGAGAWVVELASAFPHLQVTGIDHRPLLIDAARALAWQRGLTNATFWVADVREEAPHPGASFASSPFDLVNLACMAAWTHRVDYPGLVQRLWRLCRPGGMLRWTEGDMPVTTSPALAALAALFSHTAHAEGSWRFPCEHRLTLTHLLGGWLREAGFQHIRYVPYVLEVSASTPAHLSFVRQVWLLVRQARAFLLDRGVISAEGFEQLVAQAQHELREQRFRGLCLVVTVRGEKSTAERTGSHDVGDGHR